MANVGSTKFSIATMKQLLSAKPVAQTSFLSRRCSTPKRVLDGEGFWGSRKLRRCPVWIRREYPYLYPLADCNGNFELDIPVILGKLKANRPDLSIRKLELIFDTFKKEGLTFVWSVVGRHYVHWTGSERRGRLPQPSHRSNKYERKLAPPYPQEEYAAYLQQFGELVEVAASTGLATTSASASAKATATDRAKEKEHTAQASPSLDVFERFWKAYPNKVGKPAAQRAWKKMPPRTPYENVMAGLERWKQTEQWQKEGGQFIPYPATFLNQRRWEDEPPATEHSTESSVGRGPQLPHEKKVGKCSKCGKDTVPGLAMCYQCLTPHWRKQAPVKP